MDRQLDRGGHVDTFQLLGEDSLQGGHSGSSQHEARAGGRSFSHPPGGGFDSFQGQEVDREPIVADILILSRAPNVGR